MVEGSTRLPSGTSLTQCFRTILVALVTLRSIQAEISDPEVSRPRPLASAYLRFFAVSGPAQG